MESRIIKDKFSNHKRIYGHRDEKDPNIITLECMYDYSNEELRDVKRKLEKEKGREVEWKEVPIGETIEVHTTEKRLLELLTTIIDEPVVVMPTE